MQYLIPTIHFYMPFSRFEALARQLVEGSFSRLFGGPLEPLEIAGRLARAMEDNQQDGRSPDLFWVYLSPTDYRTIDKQNGRFTEELTTYVLRLAQQAQLSMLNRPQVELREDARLGRQEVHVFTGYQKAEMPTTQLVPRDELEEDILAAVRELDAFLIIGGQQHVPLNETVITIGRRMDNDIVLESAAISRQHAQIRWRYGRFILYDLTNRNRTLVNGHPIIEYALQPGDVIALSDVLLIYGEGRQERPSARVGNDKDKTLMKPRE